MQEQSGFTLLEILVVMLLMGLMAGMALPQLERTVRGVEVRSQRDAAVADLSRLSYRLYVLGRRFELTEKSASQLLDDGEPAVHLARGWTLAAEQPIQFSAMGVCSGGTVQLKSPFGESIQLDLAAPACKVTEHAP